MNKKIFNKSGIAIDFGATKISVSQIIKGKFKKTITEPTSICLLYTSPSPRDRTRSRMPSSA